MLHLCKPGFEALLERELAQRGCSRTDGGAGWVLATAQAEGGVTLAPNGLCFATLTALHPVALQAPSVNAMQRELERHFRESMADVRIQEPWPLHFEAADDEGLAGRSRVLERAWRKTMARKMARVFKLATPLSPKLGQAHGFFVVITDFDRCYVAREAFVGGQRRMKVDPKAPSRSYLKVEEALAVLDFAPGPGDHVADLGAAPGGWSYAAAKRGAKVSAVDNGPLKGIASGHPLIRHLREDAFKYHPKGAVDWLLCDMLENPYEVAGLVERWLRDRRCRHFVVNLKCGKVDPIAVMHRVFDPSTGLAQYCRQLLLKQLHHDREEVTLMGSVK